jgi:hypothetical protein
MRYCAAARTFPASSRAAVLQCRAEKGRIVYASIKEHPTTMADDPSKRGPQDRSRINVNEPHEVRYWTQTLGVTEAQLRVRVYLGKP